MRNLNTATSLHASGRLKLKFRRKHGWKECCDLVSMAARVSEGGLKNLADNLLRLERVVDSVNVIHLHCVRSGYEFKVPETPEWSGRRWS